MYQHQVTSFKNGLKLVTVPMPQVESTTVLVAVKAGSRYETRAVRGLFHFLEHMAFKGTKRRPTALRVASEVDAVGGEFNAFTGKELTGYFVKSAAKHQKLAFDILSDILANSLLKPTEIEKERGVIIEEINMYEDNPSPKIMREFIRLLYGDCAMGWPTAGEKKTVNGIKRNDFVNYLRRYYQPANMAVAVTGKLKLSEVKSLAKRYFNWSAERKTASKPERVNLNQKKWRLKMIHKKTEQAHFCLGVPGYGYTHPDRFALGLVATVLGGGMSSRLFTEIREKRGLAYYINCSPDFFTDSGYIMSRAGVRLGQIEEAIKIVLGEFENLTKIKVGDREFKKAKEFLKGRLILALEDSWRVASRYAGQVLLEEKIRTPLETLAEIEKVTADDVRRVAKEVFKPEKLNLALIGPYRSEGRFKKLLS